MRRFNWEYFQLYKEIPLFCALEIGQLLRKRERRSDDVLIVNTCLVGEFVASLPAIAAYIRTHPTVAVDLLVTPPLREIAQHVHGVRAVYTVQSLYRRHNENGNYELPPDTYGTILVLRASTAVYSFISSLRSGRVHTALFPYAQYGLHLGYSLVTHRTPKQWREINRQMLGVSGVHDAFEDVMRSPAHDIVGEIPVSLSKPLVLIHTGCNWPMKTWRDERWAQLLNTLQIEFDFQWAFIGSTSEDLPHVQAILPQLAVPIPSLVGKTSLLQLLFLMRRAAYFIGIDSGPANMARFAELPNITLYGPGPHMYLPNLTRDIALDHSEGGGLLQMYLARDTNRIIDKISVDEVHRAFKSLVVE